MLFRTKAYHGAEPQEEQQEDTYPTDLVKDLQISSQNLIWKENQFGSTLRFVIVVINILF